MLFDNQVRDTAVRSATMVQHSISWDAVLTFENFAVSFCTQRILLYMYTFDTNAMKLQPFVIYFCVFLCNMFFLTVGVRKQDGGNSSNWLPLEACQIL